MESDKNQAAVLWRERIQTQQSSGESIKAWCVGNGYQQHSFYWWRASLGLSPRPPRVRRRNPRLVLTEVVIGEATRPAVAELVEACATDVGQPPAASIVEPIRLVLQGGRELVLPLSMSDQRLAALVCMIEGRGSILGGRS